MIRIDVLGTPAPKGSGRAMLIGGKARFVAGSSGVNAKKQASFAAAIRERIAVDVFDGSMPTVPLFVDRPLAVAIVFRLARPTGHYGKGGLKSTAPRMPAKKPDVDKCARQVLDVLTGSIFDDDSRIVELLVRKEFARPGLEGATIIVDEWKAPPVFVQTNANGMCPPHTFAGSDHQCAVCLKDFPDRDPRVVRPLL